MNSYLIVILGSMAAAYALNTVVGFLNLGALHPEVPAEFQGRIDAEAYARSQAYARATGRFALASDTIEFAATTAFILLGGFGWADEAARALGLGELATGLAFFALLFLLGQLLSLPFALWRTFVIEQRFGFNRTTPATFALDRLKSWFLAALIGAPLAAMVLWFFSAAGPWAWLLAWAGVTAVMLALQYLAPVAILPLFNKFTPLPDGELRQALEALARDQRFNLSGLFVIDGSRRSAKSNAYFTGLGKRKRIALYDTLIQAHSTEEIVAVLAHEVGHWKRGHVMRMTASTIARIGLFLFLMSLFMHTPALFDAVGVEHISIHVGLVLFLVLYTPLTLALGLWDQALSRRYEFEADAFAAQATNRPEALIQALKTLSVSNLSNLTPHPAYVAVNYSHPPVLKRIEALHKLEQ